MTSSKRKRLFGLKVADILALVGTSLDAQGRGVALHLARKIAGRHGGTSHRLPLDDIEVYYEIYGDGDPILLLHGGTAFVETYFGQIPALAPSFKVIAPDLRAHGRTSDSPRPLTYGLMADDAVRLLDALGARRTHVVGWSDGGVIGLEMAMRYPERVGKLVLMSAPSKVEGMLPSTLEMVRELTPYSPFVLKQALFYRMVAPDPGHWPTFIEKIKTMWLAEPHYTLADLARVRAETLVMAGERDMIDPRHCQETARLIPRARYREIPEGTHSFHMEQPDLVNEEILAFLKGDAEHGIGRPFRLR
jgi:pimeloyl-ACP methyl ester carboxylesterase